LDAETKKLVERAAALDGSTLAGYCRAVLIQAAQATIARHETIVLSPRDRELFFDILIQPRKPNARLKRAFRTARDRIIS
jgi:uncharacterized protein (DUF1778 family)